MKSAEQKEFVALFAKTALLENELAELIDAQERAHRASEEHRPERSSRHLVAGFLVVFGVVAVAIAFQQFSEITTARRETAERLRSVADSAEATRNAQRQLGITQQHIDELNDQAIKDKARLEQRGRVSSTVVAHPLRADQPIWITANMVNSGMTDAVHAERADAIVLTTKEPTSFANLGKWKNLGVLEPALSRRYDFKGTTGLTQAEIEAIRSGGLLLVTYGTLKYDDIFGMAHFTGYCLVYTPDTSGFSNCRRHNLAD
jgi:hypothetical protein